MKKFVPLMAVIVSFICNTALHATDWTWDADTTKTGAQDGDGTWTVGSVNFWDGSGNSTPVDGSTNNIIIGGAVAGAIAISNGGQTLSYTNIGQTTFNQSYTINAAAAGDGLSAGNITIKNGAVVNFNAVLDAGSGGTKTWDLQAGSTLNLSGGGRIQNINGSLVSSTLNILSGTYGMGGGTANNGGAALGGSSVSGTLIINQSAGVLINGGFNLGGNTGNNTCIAIYNLNGGTINTNSSVISLGSGGGGSAAGAASVATFNINSGANVNLAGGELRIGNDGGSGVLNMNGDSLITTNKVTIARRSNTGGAIVSSANFNSGTTVVQSFQLGDTGQSFVAGSQAAFNLNGGSVYISNNGTGFTVPQQYANLATTINLSGGTLGAVGSWSSSMAMNLSNANGGVTFKASGTDTAGAAKNISLSGKLTGGGGFTKTGAGTLLLSAHNDYHGNTVVNAGTLTIDTTGGLTFYLNADGVNNVLINSGGIVNFNGSITIDLTNAATAGDWQIISGSITYGTGFTVSGWTWDNANTWTFGNYSFNKTTGLISAIPEPSTYMLLGMGVMMVSVLRRRRLIR